MRLPERPLKEELEEHKAKQRTVFDSSVHLFDIEVPREVIDRLRRIVGCAEIREGDAVLDVGTGIGVLIPMISAFKPGKMYACDLSEKMLERLKEKFPEVETYCCDVVDLQLPDDSIDVVFMNAVFPNILDKEGALLNARRMLKKGGRLLISHPLGRTAFIGFLRDWGDRYFGGEPGEDKFRFLLSATGFTLVKYEDSDLFLVVASG